MSPLTWDDRRAAFSGVDEPLRGTRPPLAGSLSTPNGGPVQEQEDEMAHWPPKIVDLSVTGDGDLYVAWEVDTFFADAEAPDEQSAQLGATKLPLNKDDREVTFPADVFANLAGDVGGSVTFYWTEPPEPSSSAFWVSVSDGSIIKAKLTSPSYERHAPKIRNTLAGADTIRIEWLAEQNYDFYIVRYGEVGLPPDQEPQVDVRTSGKTGSFTADHLRRGVTYHFAVKGCDDHLFSFSHGSSCSDWSDPVQVKTLQARWPFPIAPGGAAGGGSGVAAAVRGDEVDVFWVGPDGGIGVTFARMSLDGGRWQQPFPIAPSRAAREGSPVAAVLRPNRQFDVFWIGPDGGIGTTHAIEGGAWQQPVGIAPGGAAAARSGLTAVVRGPEVDVFWVGPDGGIGTTCPEPSVDGNRWQRPFPIAPGGAAREGSPVAAAVRGDQLDAYWIGPNGGIGSNFVNPQQPRWL
jgi:hypothetical protein